MDLFKEIDDLGDLFLLEKNTKLDSAVEGYEDLQSRYSSLHEDYAKEIENSKKVEKCLIKCLKFYSKLCKKYEAQQKIISNLEQTVKEKIISLEEAQRNEEKLKGLIEMYRTERAFYMGKTSKDLKKDKEILLDICCRLIGESVRNNNIRNLTNLLLQKFKKDLDDEKLNLLKKKSIKLKNESECDGFGDVKSNFELKCEMDFKTEEKYSEELSKACLKKGEELETRNDPLDLSMGKAAEEDKHREEPFAGPEEISGEEPEFASSLPLLGEISPPREPPDTDPESEPGVLVNQFVESECFQESVGIPTEMNSRLETDDGNGEAFREGDAAMAAESETSSAPSEVKSLDSTGGKCFSASGICFRSIFDIADDGLKSADLKTERAVQENACFVSEIRFGCSLEKGDKSGRVRLEKDPDPVHPVFDKSEEEQEEEELFRILREMSSVRLPSPVTEICDPSVKSNGAVLKGSRIASAKGEPGQKRNSGADEGGGRNKKLKSEEERPSGGLLDSIMSAMSLQNEEFKSKGPAGGESEGSGESEGREEPSRFAKLGTRIYSRRKKSEGGHSKENSSATRRSPRTNQSRQNAVENVVMEEIRKFVSSEISSKEDADRNVKLCLSVLSSKPEDVIAKCVVAMVLENVDEAVEIFERPAPPLTRTQHRLIVLLSVFRTFDSTFERITTSILTIISEKLFPDNFFWPDDSLEATTRFYAALCRARNDPKTLWRFCLQAMTDMRQRCPLLVFTVLKTWPDVLYNAATLKNNGLAVTIVNIFLHMPKTEGLRNSNQGRKLVALKHLLMNFYQFKVEDSMEGYGRKVLEGIRREEPGAEKSVVLLSKCMGASWTAKHVVPGLKSTLSDWSEGKVGDAVGGKVLGVAKQICCLLLQEGTDAAKVREFVCCLSEVLTSGKKSHACEVSAIEVLLQLKQYPEARKMIREWMPKNPIEDRLRNEIINASAENILRELKLNKRKEGKGPILRKRLKKQSKKSKGKKKKGKKRKRGEHGAQTESAGASS